MPSISLPGEATWNTAIAGTGNHSGDTAGSCKTRPFLVYNQPFSFVVSWTGTTAGTITIYASSNWDTSQTALTADNWNSTWNSVNALLAPDVTQPAGSAGSWEISSGTFNTKAIYIDYARTSGSGAITVDYNTSA
jgi:hypothetical protein